MPEDEQQHCLQRLYKLCNFLSSNSSEGVFGLVPHEHQIVSDQGQEEEILNRGQVSWEVSEFCYEMIEEPVFVDVKAFPDKIITHLSVPHLRGNQIASLHYLCRLAQEQLLCTQASQTRQAQSGNQKNQ